jgi:multicomponent Na+:H+ antiporter subunit G
MIIEMLTIVVVLFGTFFSFVGVLGFVRLPDIYTRLHTTGKVGVFGVVFLLLGASLWTPLGWGQGVVLIFFLLITGPVAAHAIGSAAYGRRLPMQDPQRDDLREEIEKEF